MSEESEAIRVCRPSDIRAELVTPDNLSTNAEEWVYATQYMEPQPGPSRYTRLPDLETAAGLFINLALGDDGHVYYIGAHDRLRRRLIRVHNHPTPRAVSIDTLSKARGLRPGTLVYSYHGRELHCYAPLSGDEAVPIRRVLMAASGEVVIDEYRHTLNDEALTHGRYTVFCAPSMADFVLK